MNSQGGICYERVKIEATLSCLSDLHIGSGVEAEYTCKERSGKALTQTYADICLDTDKRPCIPASTLRGYLSKTLRIFCEKLNSDYLTIMTELLGASHHPLCQESGVVGMGKLRVYDALYKIDIKTGTETDSSNNEPDTRYITRTAIEPITGTSKEHQLFSCKVVNAGAQFTLNIELDNACTAHLQLLIDALGCLEGSEMSQLGKNKSLMSGRLQISDIKIRALHTEDFRAWLQIPQTPEDRAEDRPEDSPEGSPAEQVLEKCYKEIKVNKTHETAALSEFKVLSLSLYPTSPLLVNDVHLVQDEKESPNHVYTRRGEKLCIPGATLKGLIRGHCRKIVLTLLHNIDDQDQQYSAHQAIAESTMEEIFGGETAASLLRVSEAISVSDATEHLQTFIAVDRFTGGVADGALYSVEAAVADELPFELYLHRELLEKSWVTGLLLLVLRDAMEGDLSIGWGKSRGFGAFQLGIVADKKDGARLRNWPDVLNWHGSDRAEAAVEALEYHIIALIEQYIEEGEIA